METSLILTAFQLLCCFSVVVMSITYKGSDTNLQQVPGDISADTQELLLDKNIITSVNGTSISHLYQLILLDLGGNRLTTFPDLRPVSTTLEVLSISHNKISYIDPDILDSLIRLKTLKIGYSPLDFFPDVPGPGNSLKLVDFTSCGFVHFPALTNYRTLATLNIRRNPFVDIPDGKFFWLDSFRMLILTDSQLTKIPSFTEVADTLVTLKLTGSKAIASIDQSHFAELSGLKTLNVGLMTVTRLPTLCTTDLSHLDISTSGTPLDLCSCDNAWMKQAQQGGAALTLDDMTCGGHQWMRMTLQQVLDVCTHKMTSNPGLTSFQASKNVVNKPCDFPVHSVRTNVSRPNCLAACLNTKGCVSFNYRPAGLHNNQVVGTCVIIAPSVGPVPTVPDKSQSGWHFFSVINVQVI